MFRIESTWAFIKHVGMPEVDLPVDADAKLEPLPVVGEPPNGLDIFSIEILGRPVLRRDRLGILTLWLGNAGY